jgi:ribosome-associated translation inhibitor RaiA
MPAPLTVQFRHLRATRALQADVRDRFERLSHYCPTIVEGRVVVERTGLHHQGGQRFRVQIVLSLPGGEIVVDHQPSVRSASRASGASSTRKGDEVERDHVHPGVAVHDAFAAARRRLQDRVRRQRDRIPARRARTAAEA